MFQKWFELCLKSFLKPFVFSLLSFSVQSENTSFLFLALTEQAQSNLAGHFGVVFPQRAHGERDYFF
jgi:hypothetical protein